MASSNNMKIEKVWDTDPIVPYKESKISAMQTQSEINGLLARWGITKYGWDWNFDHTNMGKDTVAVTFQFMEIVQGKKMMPIIRLEPPRIWHKANPKRKMPERINWDVSMRVLWWYMKTHLEYAYLNQSAKTTEFLPFIQISNIDGKTKNLQAIVLEDVNIMKALPERI